MGCSCPRRASTKRWEMACDLNLSDWLPNPHSCYPHATSGPASLKISLFSIAEASMPRVHCFSDPQTLLRSDVGNHILHPGNQILFNESLENHIQLCPSFNPSSSTNFKMRVSTFPFPYF